MTENFNRPADPAETTTPAAQPVVIAQRYALLAELGRGGMGIVWRAQDRMIGRHVAVKELRAPDGAGDAAVFQERVLREVRTGGRVNDPAVVTVYDVVTEGDVTYIVMELVEAPTLAEVVREQGPLPSARVAAIGDQVLSALRAAHEMGVVHRDVKPGNIMVSASGRVKLTDFGIAQAVDDPRLTTSGSLVGSPAFVAPERVAGSEALPTSDLWSLGAALFFAVEGVVAFERSSTAATLHAIVNEVPYLTRAQGPLASAIMGLLAAGPDARISAEQARELLAMAGTRAGSPTQPSRTAASPGRMPTLAGGAAMLGHDAQPGSVSPGRGRRNPFVAGAVMTAVVLLVAGVFLGKWLFGPSVDGRMRPTLTFGKGGAIPTFNLVLSSGHCLNTSITKGVGLSESNWVECQDPHVAEVYATGATFGFSDSDKAVPAAYPGRAALADLAEEHCSMVFHSNAIKDELRGELVYRALIPSRAKWKNLPGPESEYFSDYVPRYYYCVLARRDGSKLTGTAQNRVR